MTYLRHKIQHAIYSRFGTRHASVFINSIPKSGTHVAIAILKAANLVYAGHYEERFAKGGLVLSHETNSVFAVGHLRQAMVTGGRRLLLFRNPVDVAISLVAYIQSRRDHYLHNQFASKSVESSVESVLNGIHGLESLATRYQGYADWAKKNEAVLIDFDDVKRDPLLFVRQCGFTTTVDNDDISHYLARWNPTKRTKRLPHEIEIKQQLLSRIENNHEQLWRTYQNLKHGTAL